jgi:type IV pilus assembly protein PilA
MSPRCYLIDRAGQASCDDLCLAGAAVHKKTSKAPVFPAGTAYQTYTVKAKVSEAILAASQCRTTISEVYQSGNPSSPPAANAWGCETAANASKYVASVVTDANGKITVTLSADTSLQAAASTVLTLVPQDSAGAVLTSASVGSTQVYQWRCGNQATDGTSLALQKYLPGSCKG